MGADTSDRCSMCKTRPMEPIPTTDGAHPSLVACANCDSPMGDMPDREPE